MASNRKAGETGIYHVTTRGVAKQEIFKHESDCNHYLDTLNKLKDEHGVRIHAWCLMKNHVHLLPQVERLEQLSCLMRDLNSTYSIYFNKRYDRVGHLFQGRFGSKPVDDEAYFKMVVRYIHQNPVGKSTASCDYRWSSYWEYTGKRPRRIATTDMVLATFGNVNEFVQFHQRKEEPDGTLDPDKSGQLSDDEAHALAVGVVGEEALKHLKLEPANRRDQKVQLLRKCGLKVRQIADETSLSVGLVCSICK